MEVQLIVLTLLVCWGNYTLSKILGTLESIELRMRAKERK